MKKYFIFCLMLVAVGAVKGDELSPQMKAALASTQSLTQSLKNGGASMGFFGLDFGKVSTYQKIIGATASILPKGRSRAILTSSNRSISAAQDLYKQVGSLAKNVSGGTSGGRVGTSGLIQPGKKH